MEVSFRHTDRRPALWTGEFHVGRRSWYVSWEGPGRSGWRRNPLADRMIRFLPGGLNVSIVRYPAKLWLPFNKWTKWVPWKLHWWCHTHVHIFRLWCGSRYWDGPLRGRPLFGGKS